MAEGREDARGKFLNFSMGYVAFEIPVRDANEGIT